MEKRASGRSGRWRRSNDACMISADGWRCRIRTHCAHDTGQRVRSGIQNTEERVRATVRFEPGGHRL